MARNVFWVDVHPKCLGRIHLFPGALDDHPRMHYRALVRCKMISTTRRIRFSHRELHPPKPGCSMDARSLEIYVLLCSIQTPSKVSAKTWMDVPKHGCASKHLPCISGLPNNLKGFCRTARFPLGIYRFFVEPEVRVSFFR